MHVQRFIRSARMAAGGTVIPADSSGRLWMWPLLAVATAALALIFGDAIAFMVGQWDMEEFSHGYLIPFISAYLAWQRRDALRAAGSQWSWYGVLLVAVGALLEIAGRLAALWPLQHVALLTVVVGLVLALAGWRVLRILAVPLAVLWFMIPLPNILLNALSAELQLISSSLGAWLIRAAGISVYLEGNVIDLGSYKLEVAQACSGLRYLLPLMTLAFLVACLFQASFWKKALLFLSSIPITLFMNSLRVASIGIMVDRWGTRMAEGALHAVQGWTMFMLSVGVLVLEMKLLARWDPARRPLRDLLAPVPAPPGADPVRPDAAGTWRGGPRLAAVAVLLATLLLSASMPQAAERAPPRESFLSFPLQFGSWSGQRATIDPVYLDVLKLDDYLMADYGNRDGGAAINLYVAWYQSQHAGVSTHSPKACLPGAGWVMKDFQQLPMGNIRVGVQPLRVNRALMENHGRNQLVYYWFQQRGRIVTNEYLVKWYLMVDSVTRHRTDGALVRVVMPVSGPQGIAAADRRLQEFVAAVAPRLGPYVPD